VRFFTFDIGQLISEAFIAKQQICNSRAAIRHPRLPLWLRFVFTKSARVAPRRGVSPLLIRSQKTMRYNHAVCDSNYTRFSLQDQEISGGHLPEGSDHSSATTIDLQAHGFGSFSHFDLGAARLAACAFRRKQ
jgi:hypothetical protein